MIGERLLYAISTYHETVSRVQQKERGKRYDQRGLAAISE